MSPQDKLPAFQFYPGDWRKDPGVQSLDYEARGVWIELLCLMHESEQRGKLTLAGRAMTDVEISQMLGLDPETAKQTLSKLQANGVASRDPESGALVSRRMVRDEDIRQKRSAAGRKGGKQTPKQTPSKPPSKRQAKQGSSSSSSVSSSSSTTPFVAKATAVAAVENSDDWSIATRARLAPLCLLAGGDEAGKRDWMEQCRRWIESGRSVDEVESWVGGFCEMRDRGMFGEWIAKRQAARPAVFKNQPQLRPQAEAAWAQHGPGADRAAAITKGLVAL